MFRRVRLLYCLSIILLGGCLEIPEEGQTPGDLSFELGSPFEFAEGFDFRTSENVSIEIEDLNFDEPSVFRVSYVLEGQEQFVGTVNHSEEITSLNVRLPVFINEVTVTRVTASGEQTQQVGFSGDFAQVSFSNASGRTDGGCIDRLYAVENSFGGFWEINISDSNFDETQFPNLEGGGSIACALDQGNDIMYYNINRTLYTFNFGTETFSAVHTGNPFNGNYPRLAFRDGFLWMSNGTRLHKVDAATNAVVESFDIEGFINSTGGGDIDFDSNGNLYLAGFSGLYKFIDFSGGVATMTRISSENFPFQLTSMAIDRQDRAFVGTNDAQSNLIEISLEDGAFQIVRTYDHKINDLTAFRCAVEDLEQTDSDGDGVIDMLDDHPDDPDAAFDVFTPSEIGLGTIGFEDLWPNIGDYDFNDLVVGYRFANVINSNDLAVRMEIDVRINAVGAGRHNGFGIELPFSESLIQEVTGSQINGSSVTLNGKGLEAVQSNPVVIVFDDAFDHVSPPGRSQLCEYRPI